MATPALIVLLTGFALVVGLVARVRAVRHDAGPTRFAALPRHRATLAALVTITPPLVFVALWSLAAPALVTEAVLATPTARALPAPGFERSAILAQARALAADPATPAGDPRAAALAPAYAAAQAHHDRLAAGLTLALALAAAVVAWRDLATGVAARGRLEAIVLRVLFAASLLAVLTTLGIVASLLFESVRFFALVPAADFLLGTHWSPQSIDPRNPGASLGAVPLFWGTFLIGAVIAMAVAVPLGLLSAIYLTQYARPATRRWAKPALEILAGVPTVVYGYLAALTVAPAVRDLGVALGIASASSESALAAGLVMGVMIIPFVSSLADDALAAVPATLRDGSLALGATAGETIRRVLVPAALPGIAGGVLLAVSRAIGETMIVVMAASGVATLTANPFAGATTVTKQIVDLLTGEAEFDSPKTLAAFALGLTLFLVTLLLNAIALIVVKRYREAYD